MKTAQEVLAQPFPDVSWPLGIARKWIYSMDDALQRQAVELLKALEKEFPYEPQVGDWLVLALLQTRDAEAADRYRTEFESRFPNQSEELLARKGRSFREAGEKALKNARKDDGSIDHGKMVKALDFFRAACDAYNQAYAVHGGHYPLICLGELYLMKAAIDERNRGRFLETARDLARRLLDSRDTWLKRLPDDNIWHLGTEAHAHVILGNWDQAAAKYEVARSQSNWAPFHGESMKNGLQRTLDAMERLGQPVVPPFDNLDAIFPVPVEAKPKISSDGESVATEHEAATRKDQDHGS